MTHPPPTIPAGSEGGHAADRLQSDADQSITVEKLDQLIDAGYAAAEAANQGLERDRVAKRRFRILTTIMLILLGVFALSVHNVLQDLGDQQKVIVEVAKTNKANGERIVSCTTPSGECYKDSVARSAERVATLNNMSAAASAAAAACAQTFSGYIAIKACVDRTLVAK